MRLLITVTTLLLAGCANLTGVDPITGLPPQAARVEAPAEAPSIRGTLTELISAPDGGTLVIQDAATGAQVNLKLSPATLLMRANNQRLSYRELQTGQLVEAWYDSAANPSDPSQARGKAVRLLQ